MISKATALQHAAAVATLALLGGCGSGSGPTAAAPGAPEPDQTNICETKSMGLATHCKPGQKVVFLPEQFGNAQLPVYFAAANCDLRYAVVLTNGAVTCIYKPIQLAGAEAASAPASQAK